MNCKEFVLDDLLAVIAIPVTDYYLGTVAWQLQPIIPQEELNPTLTNAITIGLQPAVTGGTLIPIQKATGKVKDQESDSVTGRSHTVNISCEVDDRDSSVWTSLQALERTPSHLLLTFRGGQQAFVVATEDSYQCTTERDGAKTSVTLKVHNMMGMQLVYS